MAEGILAIRAARIIDGTGSAPIVNGTVVIRNGKIAEVGPAGSVTIPTGAEVLDLPQHTVLPGLIDPHYHCSLDGSLMNYHQRMKDPLPELIVRAATNLRRHLKGGVTTVRVLGDHGFMDMALKRYVDEERLPGPRILPSGLGMRPSHGHGVMGTPTDGADRVRETARKNIEKGARVIKIFVTGDPIPGDGGPCAYSLEEIRAAVEEAHRYRTKVIAHCYGGLGARYCAEAGVDGIEHGIGLTEEDSAVVKESGMWLGLTMNSFFNPFRITNRYGGEIPDRIRRRQEDIRGNLRTALKTGVRWVLGTDAQHGDLQFEVESVVAELGAEPMDAICAATGRAAEACGIADEFGTLASGKAADVIAVTGNPLANVKDLRNVEVVIKGGKRWDHVSII